MSADNHLPPDLATPVAETARPGRIEPLPDRTGRLPLSFAQQRLWFLAQLDGASEAYHMPQAWQLDGPLDRAALGRALDALVARHEALRTRFGTRRRRGVQPDRPARGRVRAAGRGPDRPARGVGAAPAGRGQRAVRPEHRAAGPRPAGGAGAGPARAAADPAPHRLRRLVDGRADPRTGRVVRGIPRPARTIRCRRCRSSTPTTRPGSGPGSPIGVLEPSRPSTGSGRWPARRRCWSCPPTGPDRPSRTTAAASSGWRSTPS